MKSKVFFIFIAVLLSITLLSACGKPAPEEESTSTISTTFSASPTPSSLSGSSGTTELKTSTTKEEKPQYGGMLKICVASDVLGFDESFTVPWYTYTLRLTNDELLEGDWAKGLAGTGKSDWTLPNWPADASNMTGCLAESWEMTDPLTYVFHLRHSVHFANSGTEAAKLVNGREVTAQDYVFSAERLINNTGFYYNTTFAPASERPVFTALDNYTLEMKIPTPDRAYLIEHFGDKVCVVPNEVINKYGDLRDWRNSVGSGPFMLMDVIMGGSYTFNKNPNYWKSDPLRPENQLPYLDSVQFLVMQDASTRLAAMRTGKIDQYYPMEWEDGDDLIASNPDMQYRKSLITSTPLIYFRCDNEPTSDIRVRKALSMAINRDSIIKDYYGGNAELLTYLVAPLPDFVNMYTPLDQLPADVREQFEYNPEKAKQLLADAGYSTGLKLDILCSTSQAEFLSIIQDNFKDIGVNLALDIKEPTVYNSAAQSKSMKNIVYMANSWATDGPPGFRLTAERYPSITNYAMMDDDKINDAYLQLLATYLQPQERQQIMKDINVYYLSLVETAQLPCPYQYCIWQSWLRGYHGEYSVGFWNQFRWSMYVWLDPSLRPK
jgi:peptide/nickel transport system substrate-binding protein